MLQDPPESTNDLVRPALRTAISGLGESARYPDRAQLEPLAEADVAAEACTPDDRCPLCRSRRLHYAFSWADRRVVSCAECRLVLLNSQPAGSAASTGADVSHELPESRTARLLERTIKVKAGGPGGSAIRDRDGAGSQLRQLARYRGDKGGAMLIVEAGETGLASGATSLGFRVTHVRLRPEMSGRSALTVAGENKTLSWLSEIACAELSAAGLAPGSFDVCVLTGVLETAPDPMALLRGVHRLLMPQGVLLVMTPSLDTLCAHLAQDDPQQSTLGPARLTYFDFHTIQTALHRAGFDQAIVESSHRPDARLASSDVAGWAIDWVRRSLAQALWGDAPHPGGVLALARAAAVPACRVLSVIVPAYNEAATVGPLLDALLSKRVARMRIEVIVVESNSTDETRTIVQKYASHPRLRLVLEDRPRGKGHAVRAGLAHATGDYVLIQDADLEYDLEDYDVLLEPLAAGREALVLGSRHGGNAWWKMRRFAGQPLASFALNFGHWFFTTLLNTLFGQRLRDPFTMYKVFRRDCIFGLDFKCNRFDFDYELLVKMIRKGYQPIEIPVNYRSRSFKEGKKISALRDPFNWLKALAWLRFVRVDPLAEVQRRRVADEDAVQAEQMAPAPHRAAA